MCCQETEQRSMKRFYISKFKKYQKTRSAGALRAPTSSMRPFGPLLALRASLTSSFAPFGRSGRVTHADVSMMHVSIHMILDPDACMHDAYIYDH